MNQERNQENEKEVQKEGKIIKDVVESVKVETIDQIQTVIIIKPKVEEYVRKEGMVDLNYMTMDLVRNKRVELFQRLQFQLARMIATTINFKLQVAMKVVVVKIGEVVNVNVEYHLDQIDLVDQRADLVVDQSQEVVQDREVVPVHGPVQDRRVVRDLEIVRDLNLKVVQDQFRNHVLDLDRNHVQDLDRDHGHIQNRVQSLGLNQDPVRSLDPNRDRVRSQDLNRDRVQSLDPNRDHVQSLDLNRDHVRNLDPNRDHVRNRDLNQDRVRNLDRNQGLDPDLNHRLDQDLEVLQDHGNHNQDLQVHRLEEVNQEVEVGPLHQILVAKKVHVIVVR